MSVQNLKSANGSCMMIGLAAWRRLPVRQPLHPLEPSVPLGTRQSISAYGVEPEEPVGEGWRWPTRTENGDRLSRMSVPLPIVDLADARTNARQ
jgi:hypothetical protein